MDTLARIEWELHESRSFSTFYSEKLEERLPIALIRNMDPNNNRQSRHRRKVAHRLYNDVFEYDHHTFLLFILAISPRACESFNLSAWRQSRRKHVLCLGPSARTKLEAIASNSGFSDNLKFKDLIRSLFPTPRPTTAAADPNSCYEFDLATLTVTRAVFGQTIWDCLGTIHTASTQCVKTTCSKGVFQDGIISVEVEYAKRIADIFFPSMSKKVFRALSSADMITTSENSK